MVRDRGAASVQELADHVRSSQITVRRDLDYLARVGLVARTRGGAVAGAQGSEPTYAAKAGQGQQEKRAIARTAAALVHDDDVVVLGPGTTTEALALALADKQGLTVVTNSLLVADLLADRPTHRVICTGGELRGSIRAFVGDTAIRSFAAIHADIAFLSGNGLDAGFGLSTPNLMVAETDRAIARTGERLVVLADHTKIGTRTALQTVAPEAISCVITDADGPEIAALRSLGVDVLLAGDPAGDIPSTSIDGQLPGKENT